MMHMPPTVAAFVVGAYGRGYFRLHYANLDQAIKCYMMQANCAACTIPKGGYSFVCQMNKVVPVLLKTLGSPPPRQVARLYPQLTQILDRKREQELAQSPARFLDQPDTLAHSIAQVQEKTQEKIRNGQDLERDALCSLKFGENSPLAGMFS